MFPRRHKSRAVSLQATSRGCEFLPPLGGRWPQAYGDVCTNTQVPTLLIELQNRIAQTTHNISKGVIRPTRRLLSSAVTKIGLPLD